MQAANQLFKDLSTAENHTSQLASDSTQLDQRLTTIATKLRACKRVSHGLHELGADLDTAIKLLDEVRIIPEVGAQAAARQDALIAYRLSAQQATSTCDTLEKAVTLARHGFQQAEVQLRTVGAALSEIINRENSFLHALGRAQRCITSLPAGSVSTRLEYDLDNICGEVMPLVARFDAGQVELLQGIEATKLEVEELENWANSFVALQEEVVQVSTKIQPLVSGLRELANALKQSVSVPYGGYPKICHHQVVGVSIPYPCGWHAVRVSFSIPCVLRGLSGVAKPIESALGSAANAVLHPLLRSLHLNVTLPALPGLSSLRDVASHFETYCQSVLQTIDTVEANATTLTPFTQSIENFATLIESIGTQCAEHASGAPAAG